MFNQIIEKAFYQRTHYMVLTGFILLMLNNTMLAITQVMEAKRLGSELPFNWLEPFIWEYSSAVAIVVLLPLIKWLWSRYPLTWHAFYRLFPYILFSVIFSLFHVAIMVMLRELIYWLNNADYYFAIEGRSFIFELLYEYQKDVWTFVLCLLFIQGFSFVVSRLHGEAKVVGQNERQTEQEIVPERLLVKKLGKEFLIQVDDIEWMEAAGNYVNLHIAERIYPIRITLNKLTDKLSNKGFCRIHRSYAVNLKCIQSVEALPSGDSEITLKTGKKINLSRRYKEAFKKLLG